MAHLTARGHHDVIRLSVVGITPVRLVPRKHNDAVSFPMASVLQSIPQTHGAAIVAGKQLGKGFAAANRGRFTNQIPYEEPYRTRRV